MAGRWTDADERRRVALMLRTYGPTTGHFADHLLAAREQEVVSGTLTGPITDDYVLYWTWRGGGPAMCGEECTRARVGMDALASLAAEGGGSGLHYLRMIRDTGRDDGGMVLLEVLHDDAEVLVMIGHDGPPHAVAE